MTTYFYGSHCYEGEKIMIKLSQVDEIIIYDDDPHFAYNILKHFASLPVRNQIISIFCDFSTFIDKILITRNAYIICCVNWTNYYDLMFLNSCCKNYWSDNKSFFKMIMK